jgi:hypothetical protein
MGPFIAQKAPCDFSNVFRIDVTLEMKRLANDSENKIAIGFCAVLYCEKIVDSMKKKYILLAIVVLSLGSFYARHTLGSTEAPHLHQIENTKEWRKSYELERTSPIEAAPQVLSPLPLERQTDSIVFTPRGAGKHFTFNEKAMKLAAYRIGYASGIL